MAGTVLPPAMRDALRGIPSLAIDRVAFRNGPANAW